MISNYSKQTIENSCKILELMLEVSIECQLTLDTYSFESVKNIHLLYILLSKGEVLLTSVDELQQNSELEATDICNEIYQKELEVPSFAQKMCLLRRKMAQGIYDSSHDTSTTCQFNAFLDKLIHILQSRNLDIYSLFLEENFVSMASSLEVEYVTGIQNYIENMGWESIPLGEREESILCICYHYCTQGYYLEALDLVSSSIESGLSNHLIYFCYFRLSIKCQKFEEAIQVYNTMIQLMPSYAILPTDRYQIEKILYDNFQETTYQGRDLYTEITILVKVLKNPPPEVLQNIKEHGKAKHSKILEVLDIRETIPERPAIVCEYFDGISLEKYIEEKKGFSFSMWEEISMQILGAMAHVHDLGIFHGNITPKNILFDEKNVKICNLGFFGTQFWGEKLGIKNFAEMTFYAPESLVNNEINFSSDVYSLGKLLYYLFVGYIPTDINGQVPISEFFEKSTNNIKEERYENAEEMLKNFAEKVQTAKSAATKSESTTKNTKSFFSSKTNTSISLPDNFIVRNNEIICEKDGSVMIPIPEGLFHMGSQERNSESPVHEVFLDSYLIDKYPVTNKQYMKFLNDVGRIGTSKVAHPKQNKTTNFVPKHWNTPQYSQYSNSPNHPVIFVDWWDAWAYANWAGKKLPTEAEWEKAARGNDQRIYPWGNQPPTDKFANFGGNIGHTTPIGSYSESVSPYGCSDMSGNIWEWCVDTYDAFFYQNRGSTNNPENTMDKPSRSLRGGSWNDAASSIRTTVRGCWMNIVRYGYIGFRCVYKLNNE